MARQLRVEYNGACYHVMNRGNRGMPVFSTTMDHKLFLNKLHEYSEIFDISIRAYCLMSNHFHLYVNTPRGNLSDFMHSFLTSFTLSKNRRDKERGHLFQGRYKAILVEDELYSAEVSRSIHLNPVRTSRYRFQDFEERRSVLRSYSWSSYAAVTGLKSCPRWIDRHGVLEKYPGSLKEKQAAYTQFVQEGLVKEIADPYEAATAGAILGSPAFVERIRREFTTIVEKVTQRHDRTQENKVARWLSLEAVNTAVARHFGVAEDELFRKGSKNNQSRQMACYCACLFCRGRYRLKGIAAFYHLSPGGLASGRRLFRMRLKKDRGLRKLYRAICADLGVRAVKV